MPEKKHLVPWSTDQEFLLVATWIFSENPRLHRKAIDAMNMWRARLPPSKISRSIICTIDLLNSERECEQGLSLSLMRFVSLLSDEEQDRNKLMFSTPLYASGTNVGIPLWIVDLRNNIAHNTLPKLPILQAAHKEALHILQENFWTPNVNAYHELQDTLSNEFSILSSLFVDYQQENFQLIRMGNTDNKRRNQALLPICTKICNMMKSESLCLRGLDLLLTTGYLLPSEEQLIVLKIKDHHDFNLASKVISFWIFLLKCFKNCSIISKLIEATIARLIDSNSIDQKHLIGWSLAWLRAIQDFESNKRAFPLSKCISDSVIEELKWYKLLHIIVFENISSLTAEIAELIIKLYKPTLPPHTQSLLSETCHLILLNDSNKNSSKCQNINQDEAESRAGGLKFEESEVTLQKNRKPVWWSRDDSLTNWSNYPFGTCPGLNTSNLYALIDR